jgi:hypothetical protein
MYVGHHYAHTHTINENKTCALQQTTGKTGTKHRLCEIVVNITNVEIEYKRNIDLFYFLNAY